MNVRTARIATALGFLGLVLLGWQFTGKPSASTDPAATPVKTRVALRSHSGPPVWLADKIGGIRQDGSFTQRMRLTIALANSIPDSECFAWLRGRWFDMGDGFETRLFTRILTDRLDPVEMARLHLLGKNAGQATDVLLSLTASDPEQVIALFRENPDDMAELRILAEMAKHHPALALERFLELSAFGFPEGEAYDEQSVIEEIAKSDPAGLEAALGKLAGYLQDDAEKSLLLHRLETSFDEEIQKLYSRSDGWRLFQSHLGNADILAKLFKNPADLPSSWRNEIGNGKDLGWVGNPAVADFWWSADLTAAGFTADQILKIRGKALEGIAYHDPGKALPLLDAAQLSASDRKNFIQSIFARNMTDSQTATLLDLLDSDEDWQVAKEQLPRKKGDIYVPPPQVDKPDRWLAEFADLEPRSDANRNYHNMLLKWNDEQLAELSREFHDLPDSQKMRISEKIVADDSGRKGRIYGDAILHLAATPEEHPGIIAKATQYALQWSRSDPSAAADWVNGLPAGETRDWVQKNLATQWISVDPAAAERWVNSLPQAEQSKLRGLLKAMPRR